MVEKRRLSTEEKMRDTTLHTSKDELEFHPRSRIPLISRYPPIITTLAALFFFIFGSIFLSFGLYLMLNTHDKQRSIAILVLGTICNDTLLNYFEYVDANNFVFSTSIYTRLLRYVSNFGSMARMARLRLFTTSIIRPR